MVWSEVPEPDPVRVPVCVWELVVVGLIVRVQEAVLVCVCVEVMVELLV